MVKLASRRTHPYIQQLEEKLNRKISQVMASNNKITASAAEKYEKTIKLTLATATSKVIEKMSKPVRLDDGLYSASIIQESVNWQRAIIRNVSLFLFKDSIWNELDNGVTSSKTVNSKQKLTATFFDLSSFSFFLKKLSGKRFLKLKEEAGGSTSTIFICPYGLVINPVQSTNIALLEECCAEKGIRLLDVDTTIKTGRLLCQYRNLNPLLAFVLQEIKINSKGKQFILYEVVIPDTSSSLVKLMPGVCFNGIKGYVPATALIQRNSRIPFVQYTSQPNRLGDMVIGFRAMQVIDNRLQWKVKPFSTQEGSESDIVTMEIRIPEGCSRFTGDMPEAFVNDGHVVGMKVMFKLYDAEWVQFSVQNFIPADERPPPAESQFTYNVQIIGGRSSRGKLPVFFDLSKYKVDACAEDALATWFMLQNMT